MLLHLLSVMLSSGCRLHHIWERSFGPELTEGKIEHPCARCRPARSLDGVMRRDSGRSCSGRSMFCLIRGAICCTSNARARGQEQSKRGNSELHCTTIPSTHPRSHAGVERAPSSSVLCLLACATQGFRVSTSGHVWWVSACPHLPPLGTRHSGTQLDQAGIMAHAADIAKKKHKSEMAADKKAAGTGDRAPAGGANNAAAGPLLNLAAGEEVTGLTKDEMASVCDKLEQFARKNPHRVEAAGGGGGGGRERRKGS